MARAGITRSGRKPPLPFAGYSTPSTVLCVISDSYYGTPAWNCYLVRARRRWHGRVVRSSPYARRHSPSREGKRLLGITGGHPEDVGIVELLHQPVPHNGQPDFRFAITCSLEASPRELLARIPARPFKIWLPVQVRHLRA